MLIQDEMVIHSKINSTSLQLTAQIFGHLTIITTRQCTYVKIHIQILKNCKHLTKYYWLEGRNVQFSESITENSILIDWFSECRGEYVPQYLWWLQSWNMLTLIFIQSAWVVGMPCRILLIKLCACSIVSLFIMSSLSEIGADATIATIATRVTNRAAGQERVRDRSDQKCVTL